MTTKEEYLKKLEVFQDFQFFDEDHHYEFKGERVGISVTRLIEEYANKFNAEEVASKVAEKNYKWNLDTDDNLPDTIQEVLDEWKEKNMWSCEKGHLGHEYAQERWKNLYPSPIWIDDEEKRIAINKICNQADNFYNDYKDKLEHLADEFVIGSEEYDIASAVDHLFINKLTGGLVLVDYKTNSDIHKSERYAKNMKVPLSHLKDFTLNHYYIQLSIYRYFIEKYAKIEIEDMFIVWFSENIENYEIIEIPYLKDEVIKILENRKVKNMNSVPILLIGKSGSGKSTSLRNFKKEEVAVVNVLGKPLPFKSDINAPQCDDYATIINSIKNVDRKTIVIDDAGYLITNQFMRNHSKGGTGNAVFAVYNDLADKFWNFINEIKKIDGGKTVYIIMHEDNDENGILKPKTIGKLLDDKVCIEGMFTVAIRSMFKDGKYIFKTKTEGNDIVKTPFDMMTESEMENDLKAFDNIVREYYELDKKEEK